MQLVPVRMFRKQMRDFLILVREGRPITLTVKGVPVARVVAVAPPKEK